MSLLFRRKVEVLCAGRRFELDQGNKVGYDIQFNIPFDEKPEPKIATIDIYNLAPATRNLFQKGERIILNAGYGNDVGTIFAGKVENAINRVEGVDIKTGIEAGDGAEEWQKAYVSESFIPGTTASLVIQKMLSGFGLKAGRVNLANDIVFTAGKSIHGPLLNELKKIVADCESKIYTTGGLIYILPIQQGQEEVVLLNSGSGLISSPVEYDDEQYQGYMVEMLLNNKVNVDTKIRIESKLVNGLFRVVKGRHVGDQFLTEAVVVSAT